MEVLLGYCANNVNSTSSQPHKLQGNHPNPSNNSFLLLKLLLHSGSRIGFLRHSSSARFDSTMCEAISQNRTSSTVQLLSTTFWPQFSGCEPLPSVAYILTIRSTHHHSWAIVRIARGGIEITNSSRGSWDDYNERTMKNMVDIVNRKVGSELNRKRCIGVLTE
jgi:hypothetical protein